MVIGLSGVQFGLYHTSDYRNRKTAQREPDLIITSMITNRIGRLDLYKHYLNFPIMIILDTLSTLWTSGNNTTFNASTVMP